MTVEDTAGDELAFVGEQIHDIAVGRFPVDAIDRRIEHPRMPGIEGPGFARFQDCLGTLTSLYSSRSA